MSITKIKTDLTDCLPEVRFQVRDEAMTPEYPVGCRIVAKHIDLQTAKFFQWGETYLLNTVNGPVLRRIRKSDQEGFITCIASSPDQNRWQPFDIPLKDDVIYGIYMVTSMAMFC